MAGNLVHFELGAKDTARAREFWGSLFGWQFRPPWGGMEYHMTEGLQPGGAIDLPPLPAMRTPLRDCLHYRASRSSHHLKSSCPICIFTDTGCL